MVSFPVVVFTPVVYFCMFFTLSIRILEMT